MDKLSVKEYKNPFEEKGIREENRSRRKKQNKNSLWGKARVKSDSLNEVKAAPFRPEQVTKAYSHSENHAVLNRPCQVDR